MSFEGKVVLLTGAGGGIGGITAKHLASLGAHLALVDCNSDGLKRVADEITATGFHTPLVIVADLTRETEHIITATIEKFGKLDVLINNAGIVARNGLIDLQMDEYDRIMNTNTRSMVMLSKSAVPYLELSKGNIINISSITACRGCPQLLAYSMSKAAINQFTKCIAVELGPKGIRVNAVNPGIVKSNMINDIPEEIREEMLKYFKDGYPMRRIGEPIDIARAIAYLASENANFITGTIFVVDGGALAANIV